MWKWVLHDDNGRDLRSTDGFETQEAAEEWMGDRWSELLDEGAGSVSLMDDEKSVYTMGLRPE
jgi:hypothetical protein